MRCASSLPVQYLPLLLELKTLSSSIRQYIIQELETQSDASIASIEESQGDIGHLRKVTLTLEQYHDDVERWITSLEDEFEPVVNTYEDSDDIPSTLPFTPPERAPISLGLLENSLSGTILSRI